MHEDESSPGNTAISNDLIASTLALEACTSVKALWHTVELARVRSVRLKSTHIVYEQGLTCV